MPWLQAESMVFSSPATSGGDDTECHSGAINGCRRTVCSSELTNGRRRTARCSQHDGRYKTRRSCSGEQYEAYYEHIMNMKIQEDKPL